MFVRVFAKGRKRNTLNPAMQCRLTQPSIGCVNYSQLAVIHKLFRYVYCITLCVCVKQLTRSHSLFHTADSHSFCHTGNGIAGVNVCR